LFRALADRDLTHVHRRLLVAHSDVRANGGRIPDVANAQVVTARRDVLDDKAAVVRRGSAGHESGIGIVGVERHRRARNRTAVFSDDGAAHGALRVVLRAGGSGNEKQYDDDSQKAVHHSE